MDIVDKLFSAIDSIMYRVGCYLERKYVAYEVDRCRCGLLELHFVGFEDLEKIVNELVKRGFVVEKTISGYDEDYPYREIVLRREGKVVYLCWKLKLVEKAWIWCSES